MIYGNIEFHNVEELRAIEGRDGLLLQRIPENVRSRIRPAAQKKYIQPAGVEIRFTCKSFPVTLKIHNYGESDAAAVYFGDFQHQDLVLNEGLNEITIDMPQRLAQAIPLITKSLFAPEVVRVIFRGSISEVHYIGIEGNGISPPSKDMLPGLRYIAYGTSITQGMWPTSPVLSYTAIAARRLGADLINLGAAASAFCEEAIADYIADRDDWDFCTLCLSVNMLNQGVSRDEFYQKAKYLISAISGRHPEKPVFLISIFPYYLDLGIKNPSQTILSTPVEYRNTLKQIRDEINTPNLYYFDGRDLLKDFGGLTSDLIHPGSLGMISIGESLAAKIQPVLEKAKNRATL